MIPFIIAGAIGFGIAKLLEKDNTEKFAKGGGVGSEIYMLLYDFVDEKMIEGDSVAESMINEKGYSLTYDELYDYVDEKMIEGDGDAENLLNRINSFKNGGGEAGIYNSEENIFKDAFAYLKNKLGVELSINDFTKTDSYERTDYYVLKELPNTKYKLNRILNLIGRNADDWNSLSLDVNKDYLWGKSKYSIGLSTARVENGIVKRTQNFFIYPEYANKYGELKGGIDFADGGDVDEKKVLRFRNKLVQMNVGKNDSSLDFAIKVIDMLIDGELVIGNEELEKGTESEKRVLKFRNKLVQMNVGKNDSSLDFAIKVIDMLLDGNLVVNKFAKGGVFRDFYEGQSIIVQQEKSTKLDKSVKNLFNKFSNKELVIDKIEKNTPYNIAKVFDRNTGEKAPFDVILNPKYVEQYAGGGRIDKMDKFISELAKKNTKEFSVNEYHDFRNKKYAIGVARHYFTDNDVSFSKFDTKLGDALNIDFETQGDSTFITLGINDLPEKYGVSEKWLDGKLKLINKPINNKTRNKLLSQLQERFMEDWENNLIGFAPNKKSIVWLEYDYDAQTGLEELNKDGEYVAKKGSKYEEFDNDIWDEYFSSIADDEDDEYAEGGLAKKRRRSASIQYGRSDRSVDKTRFAKPVGYRYTDEKATQLNKKTYTKPTEAQVKKYLGNGIYKENRKNRSDKNRRVKL